jgi:hypothetical protein
MDPVTRSYLRTGVLVALVFAAGVATGGLAGRAVQQRRLHELLVGDPAVLRSRLMLYALDHRLELTPDQHAEAERVLRAQEEPYRQALELSRPSVRALRRELASDLAPRLDPAQRALLEELVREGERHR